MITGRPKPQKAAPHDLHNRDIGHHSNAQQLRDPCSFLHVEPRAVVEHKGHVNDLVKAATVGARLSPTALHVQYDDHLVNVLQ